MKLKFIAFLFLAFLTSCAASGDSPPASNTANVAKSSAPSSRGEVSQTANSNSNVKLDDADKSKAETVPTERKIIRNAELNLEAASPEDSQQKITAIAETKGGFVVESTQSSSDSSVTTRDIVMMTVRVPAAKFNESLDEIRKTSSRVLVETVSGQDVTEEFVDIEARLKAKKALEAQFLEIMKQAKTVDDALSVQRQLADVRGEIEQIEGRLRFLENQTSLSTIKIRLQTPATYSPNSSGFFYQLKEAFSSGFDFALGFILVLVRMIVALLPFLIFIVLPIYLLWRYFRKKKVKTESAKEIVEEEIKTE